MAPFFSFPRNTKRKGEEGQAEEEDEQRMKERKEGREKGRKKERRSRQQQQLKARTSKINHGIAITFQTSLLFN